MREKHTLGRVQQRTSRSEEHTSELQSLTNLVCRLLLEKKKKNKKTIHRQSKDDVFRIEKKRNDYMKKTHEQIEEKQRKQEQNLLNRNDESLLEQYTNKW